LRFNLNKHPAFPAYRVRVLVDLSMLLPLDLLQSGEWADVAEITGEAGLVCRLAELGVCVGCRLQMLQAGCPCLLRIGGGRLSLRAEATQTILVRPVALSA
jgi:ferrous iron transport protein A